MKSYTKLAYHKCLICNWFGLRNDGLQCEHPEFVRRLWGQRHPDAIAPLIAEYAKHEVIVERR